MLYTRMNLRGVFVLGAILAFIVLPNLIDFLMEWLWFGAVGYRGVYLTSLRAQASLGTFILGFAFTVLYGNLWVAVSSIASPYIVIGTRRRRHGSTGHGASRGRSAGSSASARSSCR